MNFPLGEEGEFFTGADGYAGQEESQCVKSFNSPPAKQPGLWCQWHINDDGCLAWNEFEKFSHYIEWLDYMIENFFKTWGYTLNGVVYWRGESFSDCGRIEIKDNVIHVKKLDEEQD